MMSKVRLILFFVVAVVANTVMSVTSVLPTLKSLFSRSWEDAKTIESENWQ